MKNSAPVFALFILLLAGQIVSAAEHQLAGEHQSEPAAATLVEATLVTELVKKLASPQLEWDERFQAEEQLMNLASEPVLLALIPEASKGMPAHFGITNGTGSAQRDKRLPPAWQVFYAVHRLWSHHYMHSLRENGAPLASVGQRLVDYLPAASSKTWILQELGASGRSESFWVDEAEKPVVALWRDANTAQSTRALAMQCLLRNTGGKYYTEIKAAVQAYPEETDKQLHVKADRLRDLLNDALRKRNKRPQQFQVDSEILSMAFPLLPRLEKIREGGGYFLALNLGSYLSQEFKAKQSEAKYQGRTGLTPAFFADTTANALAWWKINHNKHSSEKPITTLPAARDWSKEFPLLAARVRHFDDRMASPDEQVRLKVITEITYFNNRNTKVYLPFLRVLLEDSSPKIRWQAIHRLWEHNRFFEASELPESFEVPLLGLFNRKDPQQVARLRSMAQSPEASGGWAIHTLGIIRDKDSIPLAEQLLSSSNIFTRFSAAVALVLLGEKPKGIDALKKITDASDDQTGFYRYRSAEVLYRLGHTEALETLILLLETNVRASYADGPATILEDLTGKYFATAREWREWWRKQQ